MTGHPLWRMARPNSLVDLTVVVERMRPLPELRVVVEHGKGRPGWVTSELHLSWAEAHTLAEALTDWLWRTQAALLREALEADHGIGDPPPCVGLHLHYSGSDGANEWSVYNGPGHPLAGATVNDGRVFTGTHDECKRWIATGWPE